MEIYLNDFLLYDQEVHFLRLQQNYNMDISHFCPNIILPPRATHAFSKYPATQRSLSCGVVYPFGVTGVKKPKPAKIKIPIPTPITQILATRIVNDT